MVFRIYVKVKCMIKYQKGKKRKKWEYIVKVLHYMQKGITLVEGYNELSMYAANPETTSNFIEQSYSNKPTKI